MTPSPLLHFNFPSGVNFTNVLWAAFTCADPKSAKKLLNLTVFFALLGSARVKAAHRTLVKLTPGHSRPFLIWFSGPLLIIFSLKCGSLKKKPLIVIYFEGLPCLWTRRWHCEYPKCIRLIRILYPKKAVLNCRSQRVKKRTKNGPPENLSNLISLELNIFQTQYLSN